MDLLVITDAAAALGPGELARRVRQLVAPSFPPIDVVLCTPKEAEDAAEARSPFLHSILESGLTVYGRPARRGLRHSDAAEPGAVAVEPITNPAPGAPV